jgi:hypothetical protein
MPDLEYYVLIKLKPQEDMGASILEQYAQDAADSLYPPESFETVNVVALDGFGNISRPNWAKEHPVKQQ